MQAAMAYVTTGNSVQAAKHCPQVSAKLIREWKRTATWWPQAVQECRKMKSEELDGLLTNVIHKSTDQLIDRLQNGDVHTNSKGEIHRAPVSAQKLATILAIAWDKRNLQRGEYTGMGKVDTKKQLEELKHSFEKFSKEQLEKKTYEGSVVTIEKTQTITDVEE